MRQKTSKYASFDIDSFLKEEGYDFKTVGKNIGRNWWGIKECPFCGDDRYHLGVNILTKKISCFVCGESCQIPRFVKETKGFKENEWNLVFNLVNKYIGDGYVDFDPRENASKLIWPTGLKDIDSVGKKYLLDRFFEPEEIVNEYKLQQTSHMSKLRIDDYESDFRWRIIIPIIMEKRVVSYTGRDFTERQDPKYQHPIIEASLVSTHSVIYNYDSLEEGGIGFFLEGPTDVWRLGKNCVAMMGTKFTKKQLTFISKKRLKKAFIIFDEGAQDKAKKFANALIGLIDDIRIVDIGEGDVAELDPIEAIRIKQQLMHS